MRDNPVAWLLVGALLGGVINAAVRRYATFKEGKGIALALQGEINAIIEIVLKRRYLQHLEKFIQKLSDPSHQLTARDFFTPNVSENYFPVFHSLGTQIGLLTDLSDSVAGFYTKAKSVIEDIHSLEEVRRKFTNGSTEIDRQTLLEVTTELHDLLHDTLRVGIQTQEDLKTFQDRSWILGIR
ncbi:MAG: hypothetical protein OEY80_10205 [Nitrospirota bacterium]|jgi:hypothetical protein|nr:hypothetical protein [Nitrospirota bacterium]MDH4361366.1 hypothetical protein [Nitrospirota bacterium]MDH5575844.1 hypothetical protein [Nitrospirota bacterium]